VTVKFGKVPENIITHPHLGDSAVRVYAALAMCRSHRTGRCNPSQSQLVATTGKAIRTVRRCLRELEKAGCVQIHTSPGRETLYVLPHLEKPDETPVTDDRPTPVTDGRGPRSNKVATPVKWGQHPPYPPNKEGNRGEQRVREARTRAYESTNPMTLTEVDLLTPAPDFDEEGCFQHFLDEQKKHKRTRILPALVRHAIKVLHGDPTIEPRLGTEEIKLILSNWMEFGQPFTVPQLFEIHETFEIPHWEVCLHFAQKRNGRPTESTSRSIDEIAKDYAW
jgi:hypothetical protein